MEPLDTVNRLTNRERTVLQCIAEGKSTKEIAHSLGISFKTAACHRYRLLAKLGATNAADLMCRAARLGFIDLNAPSPGRDSAQPVVLPGVSTIVETTRHQGRKLMEALREQRTLIRRLSSRGATFDMLLVQAPESRHKHSRIPQTEAEEIRKLREMCLTALRGYIEQATRTCSLLESMEQFPLSSDQWLAALEERTSENFAHDLYHSSREHLFQALKPKQQWRSA
jgi:DNA-binding CsgD family transcriptional regulator